MTDSQKRISDLRYHLDASAERIQRECEAMRAVLDAMRHDARKFGWPESDLAALVDLEQRIVDLEECTRPAEFRTAGSEPKRSTRPGKPAALSS
jgi:hypothetical protein